jgi:bifunctional UDP-N-acetylglucosamine pyrophosphorylase/glucosamine-1-phosphate N-acetyltransferase
MLEGVTIVDPDSVFIDAGVTVGQDTVIWPQTYLLGDTRIGANCKLGPFVVIEDSTMADGVMMGPFARLRPGAKIGRGVHLGNFVEVKKSTLAPGIKVNHLSYVGDATVGENVNVGAGAITCNYDGFNKHPTVIGAGAFIGSNVNMVAPLKIGKGAIIGAGSTVTKDVPADALALERAQQLLKPGWASRHRKTLAAERKKAHG